MNVQNIMTVVVGLMSGLGAMSALADEAPASPAAPTLDAVLNASGITVNGYIDTAYNFKSGKGLFTSGSPTSVFDQNSNSFDLHQVGLIVAKQPKEGVGAYVNLTAGKDANVIKSNDTAPTGTSNFDVTQAYVQYASGAWTTIGGKYTSLAGAEVINSTAGTNYSKSILFGAVPFTHTGIRSTWVISDSVSLIGGLNNGWDNGNDDNQQKTLELGLTVAPSKTVSLALSGYSGHEQSPKPGNRNLLDMVATYNASDKLTLILNGDYLTQTNNGTNGGTGHYSGVAGYANYMLTDSWRLSVRGEYFDDNDGIHTGVVQKWKEETLTVSYLASKNSEFRAEIRGDQSDKQAFQDRDGNGMSTQQSFAIEGIYKF